MFTQPRVAVLGDLNIDLTLTIHDYPRSGGEAIASAQHQQLGGSAANTAILLAKLGHAVRFAGRTGNDAGGRTIREGLATLDIDQQWIGVDPVEPTQTNVVIVDDQAERTMFAYRGANRQLAPDHLEPQWLSDCAWLHLSGYALLEEPQRSAARAAVDQAQRAGIPISLDVPVDAALSAADELRAIIPALDTLMIGPPEIEHLTQSRDWQAGARQLIEAGARRVAVKLGADGAALMTREALTAQPAVKVNAIDTTGAGDAFGAGIISALVRELTARECLALATSLGAQAASVAGAGLGLLAQSPLRIGTPKGGPTK